MCGAGFLQTEVGGEDTWGSWGGSDPLASDDGRYESLRGKRYSIHSQRGGMWADDFKEGSLSYAMSNIDKDITHQARIKKSRDRINKATSGSSQKQRFYGSDGSTWT